LGEFIFLVILCFIVKFFVVEGMATTFSTASQRFYNSNRNAIVHVLMFLAQFFLNVEVALTFTFGYVADGIFLKDLLMVSQEKTFPIWIFHVYGWGFVTFFWMFLNKRVNYFYDIISLNILNFSILYFLSLSIKYNLLAISLIAKQYLFNLFFLSQFFLLPILNIVIADKVENE